MYKPAHRFSSFRNESGICLRGAPPKRPRGGEDDDPLSPRPPDCSLSLFVLCRQPCYSPPATRSKPRRHRRLSSADWHNRPGDSAPSGEVDVWITLVDPPLGEASGPDAKRRAGISDARPAAHVRHRPWNRGSRRWSPGSRRWAAARSPASGRRTTPWPFASTPRASRSSPHSPACAP